MSDLASHLRFLAELGIDGVSRDPAWTTRVVTPTAPTTVAPGLPDVAPATQVVAPGTEGVAPCTSPQVPAFALRAPAGTPSSAPGPSPQAPGPRPQTPGFDPAVVLAALRAEIGPDCSRCKLHALGRRQVVFGIGNPNARLMFVGEGPGADEDIQGEPFVGRAGQLLTNIIKAMGLAREAVYIANVVKCRPPGNRAPEPDEVATCGPFLERQIDAIGPEVIVALGASAAQALLQTKGPISRLRGQVLSYRGARLVPTFHPAFLLRSPERKRDVWDDMKKVMAMLGLGESK
jgi:DNA polymerase